MRILLLIIVLIATNCTEPNTNQKEAATASTPTENSDSPTEPPFPVFTTFDQLEPLLHQKTDTTYVINFWATWCKPCVAELPYFEELTEKYQNEKVKVILVSLDFPKDIEKKLVPFVEKRQLKSDVVALLDGKYNNWIDKVSPDWGGAIPATLIYDAHKRDFYEQSFENLEEVEEVLFKIYKS